MYLYRAYCSSSFSGLTIIDRVFWFRMVHTLPHSILERNQGVWQRVFFLCTPAGIFGTWPTPLDPHGLSLNLNRASDWKHVFRWMNWCQAYRNLRLISQRNLRDSQVNVFQRMRSTCDHDHPMSPRIWWERYVVVDMVEARYSVRSFQTLWNSMLFGHNFLPFSWCCRGNFSRAFRPYSHSGCSVYTARSTQVNTSDMKASCVLVAWDQIRVQWLARWPPNFSWTQVMMSDACITWNSVMEHHCTQTVLRCFDEAFADFQERRAFRRSTRSNPRWPVECVVRRNLDHTLHQNFDSFCMASSL